MSIQVAIHTTRRYEKFKAIVQIIKEEIPRPEEVEFHHTPTDDDVRKIADKIDILVCYTVPREAFEQADRLSWIHIGTAGIDHTSFPELLKSRKIRMYPVRMISGLCLSASTRGQV